MNILQLSNATKNKILDNVFKPSTQLYVMIPIPVGSPQSDDLPSEEIIFDVANNGQISLTTPVHLTVGAGTTIDAVYLHTSPLTEPTKGNALVRIDLTGDDVKVYNSNGVYVINRINVAINT